MGSLLREVGVVAGLPDGDSEAAEPRRPHLRPAEFPQLTELTAELGTQDPDGDFEFGLDLLVHAMSALRPAHAAR
jgi:hypothetical protein